MTRLALVMIARDEAASIGRALESARPFVDRMIVLDTGSTDTTREIAAAAGAEVHSFTWCDDFATACNFDPWTLPILGSVFGIGPTDGFGLCFFTKPFPGLK